MLGVASVNIQTGQVSLYITLQLAKVKDDTGEKRDRL